MEHAEVVAVAAEDKAARALVEDVVDELVPLGFSQACDVNHFEVGGVVRLCDGACGAVGGEGRKRWLPLEARLIK